MENNNVIFKRIKINRWTVVVSLVAFFTFLFLYIFSRNGIYISMTMPSFVILMELRYILTVDDNFVIFKTYFNNVFKISVIDIENIEVKQRPLRIMEFFLGKIVRIYTFYFSAKEVVSMQLKNGKTYQLRIKNAHEIKEEIEKRMNK